MAKNTVEIELKLLDRMSKDYKQIAGIVKGQNKKIRDDLKKTGTTGGGAFKAIRAAALGFGVALVGVEGISGAVSSVKQKIDELKTASQNFEATMSKAKAILKPTGQEFDSLSDKAKSLGGATIFTASQSGEAFVEMGKLGLKANEIIAASASVLDLASIAQTGMADSAETVIKTLNQFNLTANDSNHLVDVMAASFTSSALDMEKFRESMKFVGTSARLAGLDVENTTALLSVMADNGLDASIAGTSLNQVLIQFSKEGSKANKMFAEMGLQNAGVIEKLKALRDSGVDVGQVFELMDVRAGRAANVLLENIEAAEGLADSYRSASGQAKEMASTMIDNVEGATKILISAQEALGVAVGEAFSEQKVRRLKIYTELTNRLTVAAEEQRGVLFRLSKLWSDTVSAITGVSDEDLAVNEKITELNEGQLETLIEMRRQYDLLQTVQESFGQVGSEISRMTGDQPQQIEAILGVSRSLLGVDIDRLEFENLTEAKLRDQLEAIKEMKKEQLKPVGSIADIEDLPTGAGLSSTADTSSDKMGSDVDMAAILAKQNEEVSKAEQERILIHLQAQSLLNQAREDSREKEIEEARLHFEKMRETNQHGLEMTRAINEAEMAKIAAVNEKWNNVITEQERREAQERRRIDERVLASKFQTAKDLGRIARNLLGESKAVVAAQRAIAIAEIIFNTMRGSAAAVALPPIGLGPVAGVPLATAIKIQGLASAALVATQKFAGGGFVQSGPAFGDRTSVLANRGEAILNTAQQRNFMRLANGGGGRSSVHLGDTVIHVTGNADPQAIARAVEQTNQEKLRNFSRIKEEEGVLI